MFVASNQSMILSWKLKIYTRWLIHGVARKKGDKREQLEQTTLYMFFYINDYWSSALNSNVYPIE